MVMLSKIRDLKLQGSTIIIPSISIGNVPQLAMDLLINNLNPVFAGHIYHEHLVPVVGPNAFDSKSTHIASACEVYVLAEKKIVLLQIRGAIVPGQERIFTKELVEWGIKQNVKDAIVLSSLTAEVRKDEDLEGCQIRYLVPSVCREEFGKKFSSFGWRNYECPGVPECDNLPHNKEMKIYVPGGGFGPYIYENGNKMGLLTIVLMMFTYEGDNQNEAIVMADSLNQWLVLDRDTWTPPVSWSGLYGNAPPQEIY